MENKQSMADHTDLKTTSNEAQGSKLSKVTSVAASLSKRAFARQETHQYPTGGKLAVILASLYISIFLIALDRTIIGVAVPKITDEFHSTDDIGWYGSAYMLTASAFILLYGRVYTYFQTKWVFLSGIFLFEVGSALCGAAPNSTSFIIGRAIAGFGSAGIFTGAITIMLQSVPLHRRPLLQGLFGACFGVASVAGPLIGGAFTQGKAGWRWCFYINLPLGAFTILALVLFLHLPEKKEPQTLRQMFFRLDPLGNLFFLPSIICLILALQWGGTKYPWGDARVIALFVVFGILFIAWVTVEYFLRNTNATVPGRILFQRSVSFGGIFQFMVGSCFLTTVLYIPIWFQAIKGTSPVKSGIDTIPMILSLVVASIGSGAIVHRVGYYTQFLYLGSVFMAIGSGLLTTLKVDSGHSMWIGYQVIMGMGIGMSMQQSNLAVQTCLDNKDVPTGISIIFFFQTLGGAVFTAVGQNTFIDKFLKQLAVLPGINGMAVVNTGATALRDHVPAALLPKVLVAYNYSLTHGPFLVSTIVACLSIFGAMGMEWRSVKEKKNAEMGAASGAPAEMGTSNKVADVERDAESDVGSGPHDAEKEMAADTSVPSTPANKETTV
ncbi:MFS general substrate transporter [Microthyrium microscopicum]|uniref:MFS general substrate transporter n=1 Tax=Microthyrium microscopicum TaxID=703497 RepID=A0A6A6TU98_9PEZI|nr:MFS general substrate transporter [Microthyrium microscopicum]